MSYEELRRNTPVEEFDYQLLMSYLDGYTNKREKITGLIRTQKIIRVKKGLYVFGPNYRKGLIYPETLANQIYGPSYISLEYALSFYGFIPEHVPVITSVTTGVNKKFSSPLGTFLYRHMPLQKYSVGVTLKILDHYHSVLMATPEKAIIDKLYYAKNLAKNSNFADYFFDDLRIEKESLKTLSHDRLREIAHVFSNARITQAVTFIMSL